MEISPLEASVLYAGIVVDTKNFAVQTGERTFEAAAYLRRYGADPHAVSQLFKEDDASVILRAKIITEMKKPFRVLLFRFIPAVPRMTAMFPLLSPKQPMSC